MSTKKKKKFIDIIIIVCLGIFDISVLLGFVYWYLTSYSVRPMKCPVVSALMAGFLPIRFWSSTVLQHQSLHTYQRITLLWLLLQITAFSAKQTFQNIPPLFSPSVQNVSEACPAASAGLFPCFRYLRMYCTSVTYPFSTGQLFRSSWLCPALIFSMCAVHSLFQTWQSYIISPGGNQLSRQSPSLAMSTL